MPSTEDIKGKVQKAIDANKALRGKTQGFARREGESTEPGTEGGNAPDFRPAESQ